MTKEITPEYNNDLMKYLGPDFVGPQAPETAITSFLTLCNELILHGCSLESLLELVSAAAQQYKYSAEISAFISQQLRSLDEYTLVRQEITRDAASRIDQLIIDVFQANQHLILSGAMTPGEVAQYIADAFWKLGDVDNKLIFEVLKTEGLLE